MKGILLVNTGSPYTCSVKDVRSFITSMLSDPYVVSVPDWFRPILVKGLIVPLRQFSSTSHYQLIWDYTHNVSPLIYQAQQLAIKLESKTQLPVEFAMRYEKPSLEEAIEKFNKRNIELDELIVLPLFPHYAKSSYQTVADYVTEFFQKGKYSFQLRLIEPYYNHPSYIESLVNTINPLVDDSYDRLIFSFHSLPLSHVNEGWAKGNGYDYVYQTKETIRLVQKELNIDAQKIRLTYHSAMGSKWLKPDLDDAIKSMAKDGLKKIAVVCPGFAADNLETLYDINHKARNLFLKKGGKEFTYIPCLNNQDIWVDSIKNIIGD